MARLILIDIPKQTVILDAFSYRVEGGFRGFQNVLGGWHRVEVRSGEERLVGEVVLSETGTAILAPEGERLVPFADPDREALASSGAMDRALINALAQGAAVPLAWKAATGRVTLPRPAGPAPLAGSGGRARSFLAAHRDDDAALAGLQARFAAVVAGDLDAIDHLRGLWNALANAGSAVRERPAFFARAAETIAATLTVAPSLKELARAVALPQLAEDLVDDGGPEGAAAAARLRGAL